MQYEARRVFTSIFIEVDQETVHWCYQSRLEEWKFSIPLASVYPSPVKSISKAKFLRAILLVCLAPLVAGCLQHFFGVYPSVVVAASALALCYALYQFAPQYVGPIEWAAFDTEIPGRQVYLFCGSNAAEFERFVSKLNELVKRDRPQAEMIETEPTQSNTGE